VGLTVSVPSEDSSLKSNPTPTQPMAKVTRVMVKIWREERDLNPHPTVLETAVLPLTPSTRGKL
jgi:hypothetical protein